MSAPEYSFRSAAFGGFNRRDVLNYIESSARAYREKVADLQGERDQAVQSAQTAEAAAQEAQDRIGALEAELAAAKKALCQKSGALEAAETALGRERADLAGLREELGGLRGQVSRMETGARAYEELKDRTATIELEAHQRARAIEKEAEEKARRAREAAEQLLCRIRSGYERLRTEVDATSTHASGELGRVDKALECVKAEFAEHDAALEQLLLSYQEESGGRKAPEPLPLEES